MIDDPTADGSVSCSQQSATPFKPAPQIKPADLRGILEYVPMFRGHIFVIALDGSVIEHENFPNLITDIAVLRSLNINVVLVHGIGRQIVTAVARKKARGELGDRSAKHADPRNYYGEGITDAAMLATARETAGIVTQTIIEHLSRAGLRTATTNAVRAVDVGILHGVDYQFTGKVDTIDVPFLRTLLNDGVVPVFPPLLCTRDGQPRRINSDQLAAQLAIQLNASKLIFLTTHSGLALDGKPVINIKMEDLAKMFDGKRENAIEERLRSKARHALYVLQTNPNIHRAHILDGRIDGGLLTEIFDKVGTGTMIHSDGYERIRDAKKKDVQTIYNFTKHGTRNETLLHRTHAHIEQHIGDYFVFEIDEGVVACGALRTYPAENAVEICSLYVEQAYHRRGIGRRLVNFALDRAGKLGVKTVFALTTQSYTFFHDICHFDDAAVSDLPAERRASALTSGRNARVLKYNFQ
jgi:amino-acid N-acetyltransferase